MTIALSRPYEVVLDPVLERVAVPDSTGFWPSVSAFMHTGSYAEDAARQLLAMAPQRVAIDIETRGTDAGRWSVTCVTVAYRDGSGEVHGLLLDPLRNEEHAKLLRGITEHSASMVFHNGTFDVPIIYGHGWIGYADIRRVEDTIILARMVDTNSMAGRDLEHLSNRYNLIEGDSVPIIKVFATAGYAKKDIGYRSADIHIPSYRHGAIHDTVVTLRLWDSLHERVRNHLTVGAPGSTPSSVFRSREGAEKLIKDFQRVGTITLQSACRGMDVDNEYIDSWLAFGGDKMDRAAKVLRGAGLRPGNGDDLVQFLARLNYLPADWPTTKGGGLSAESKHIDAFLKTQDNPIARAHRAHGDMAKTKLYLETIREQSRSTGRIHAAVNVLGAQATGRMSYSSPALQQFNAAARPGLRADDGRSLHSVDWSSIEPVVMANCAGDREFIEPFNQGGDLYIPLGRNTNLIPADVSDEDAASHPGRKTAKVVLLAQMYGEGIKKLAADLGISVAAAQKIKSDLRGAMSTTFDFMDQITGLAESNGYITTISGRVLNETLESGESMAYRSVNHFCQGSAGDMLIAATLRLDDLGVADAIKLWIHDELVVDSEYIDVVRQAMAEVPPWLAEAAGKKGMTPVLRVDAQELGTNWRKV